MSLNDAITRRGLLRASAAASAAHGLARAGTPVGANDRVRLALIGCGPQGRYDLMHCLKAPNTTVAALCDVDPVRLAGARKEVGGAADAYADFRRVIERQDIDAVIVATPDHWHAIMALQALRSGKDVYLEKPVGHTVREGQALVEAARNSKRILQVGLQQRSGAVFQEAVRLVQSGRIGKVSVVHCFNVWNVTLGLGGRDRALGNPPDSDPPPGVDYDMWLGPAPKRPFNPNRFHWNYTYYWDYSGGMLVAWGVHLVDIVLWAMNVKGPQGVTVSGGRYVVDDSRDTPDTAEAIFDFPGFTMTYSCRHANRYSVGARGMDHGIEFYGSQATLLLNRQGYQIVPDGEKPEPVASPAGLNSGGGPHQRAFIECVRSRGTPACGILEGHRSTTTVQLGNVSYRTGRKIRWDPEGERIAGDAAAERLLTKQYRAPWSLA